MLALVFLIGICVFINYQGKPVKTINVAMSIEPFEIQDALWKALIPGQSNRKFYTSSYFKNALIYGTLLIPNEIHNYSRFFINQ